MNYQLMMLLLITGSLTAQDKPGMDSSSANSWGAGAASPEPLQLTDLKEAVAVPSTPEHA